MTVNTDQEDLMEVRGRKWVQDADAIRAKAGAMLFMSLLGGVFGVIVGWLTYGYAQSTDMACGTGVTAKDACSIVGLTLDQYLMLLAVIVALELAFVVLIAKSDEDASDGITGGLFESPLRLCLPFFVILSSFGAVLVFLGDIGLDGFQPLLLIARGMLLGGLHTVVAVGAIIGAVSNVTESPELPFIEGYRHAERAARVGADLKFGRGNQLELEEPFVKQVGSHDSSGPRWTARMRQLCVGSLVTERIGAWVGKANQYRSTFVRLFWRLGHQSLKGAVWICRTLGSVRGRLILLTGVTLILLSMSESAAVTIEYGLYVMFMFLTTWLLGLVLLHAAVEFDDYWYYPVRVLGGVIGLFFISVLILTAWLYRLGEWSAAAVSVVGLLVSVELVGRCMFAPAEWQRLGLDGLLVKYRRRVVKRWRMRVLRIGSGAGDGGGLGRQYLNGWNFGSVDAEA
ncbi:MAG: hypothetical protein IPG03_01830 [Candidatus Microthrix sp.]|nr:hypothetical protein [Candidatus Microthrix sp.]MBK6501137.1 hypothetical protein [Candidatus Microthrix sp.]